jgi:FkbM family methyltransferase
MVIKEDLIYDVGLHDGSDTAYYLRRGFRVVAIDANPAMIEDVRKTLSESVLSNRLILLNVAIADKVEERIFWVSEQSWWSSFDESNAKKEGKHAESIKVRCELFSNIMEQFGVPHYLKIDIEGSDELCIQGLAQLKDRPRYISWEASYPRGIDQLRAVRDLGYTRFKIIRQNDFLPVLGPPYSYLEKPNYLYWRAVRKMRRIAGRWEERPYGSSGPFGEGSLGRSFPWHEIAKRWEDYSERQLRDKLDHPSFSAWIMRYGLPWFDFHASR